MKRIAASQVYAIEKVTPVTRSSWKPFRRIIRKSHFYGYQIKGQNIWHGNTIILSLEPVLRPLYCERRSWRTETGFANPMGLGASVIARESVFSVA
jgi:hypothetical protein